ncbi:MAG: hypothetical protein HRT74_07780 [Flavobacteriales bacterium]|nr:hypothetical protein [Flavobacteriales bacterium]
MNTLMILNFTAKLQPMNDLFYSIAKFVEWTFEVALEPIGQSFNYFCTGMLVVGIIFWLILQKRYTAKAKNEGTIV